MRPDWLGSPQHVVGGAVLAGAVVLMARRWIDQRWLRFGLALGVSAAAEIAVELAEYPLLYSGRLHATAYYDTIADMASTIVGALVGAAVVVVALGTGAARRRYGP